MRACMHTHAHTYIQMHAHTREYLRPSSLPLLRREPGKSETHLRSFTSSQSEQMLLKRPHAVTWAASPFQIRPLQGHAWTVPHGTLSLNPLRIMPSASVPWLFKTFHYLSVAYTIHLCWTLGWTDGSGTPQSLHSQWPSSPALCLNTNTGGWCRFVVDSIQQTELLGQQQKPNHIPKVACELGQGLALHSSVNMGAVWWRVTALSARQDLESPQNTSLAVSIMCFLNALHEQGRSTPMGARVAGCVKRRGWAESQTSVPSASWRQVHCEQRPGVPAPWLPHCHSLHLRPWAGETLPGRSCLSRSGVFS
jgi:hypothetical protein